MLIDKILAILKILTLILSLWGAIQLFFSSQINKSTYKSYRKASHWIALACFLIAIGNLVQLIKSGWHHEFIDVFSIISVGISASQSITFTIALIILHTNQDIEIRKILRHIIPNLIIILGFIISCQYSKNYITYDPSDFIQNIGKNIPLTIRFAFVILYIIQLFIYTKIFFDNRAKYLQLLPQIEGIDRQKLRLNWIKYAFILALSLGIIVLAMQIFPNYFTEFLFRISTILLYLFVPIYYRQYSNTYKETQDILDNYYNKKDNIDTEKVESDGIDTILIQIKERNVILFNEIEHLLLDEKLFLKQDFKIDILTKSLNTNRTYIANAIKQITNMTISEYILKLRIQYATDLLKSDQTKKIELIAIESGFTSLRTFNRNFKELIGKTPNEFRNNIHQNLSTSNSNN